MRTSLTCLCLSAQLSVSPAWSELALLATATSASIWWRTFRASQVWSWLGCGTDHLCEAGADAPGLRACLGDTRLHNLSLFQVGGYLINVFLLFLNVILERGKNRVKEFISSKVLKNVKLQLS